MNKQELIERIANLDRVYGEKYYVALEDVLDLVKQLNKPEKVKVSEEEAKFLKTFNFTRESDVTKALYYVSRTGFCYYLTDGFDTELKGLSEGFQDLENRKRLIKAILDGYEIEKEKQYLVKFKGLNRRYIILKYDKYDKTWFLGGELEFDFHRTHHTRKQLEEDGFGWVFDCEGIKIEEVTE